MTQQVDRAEDRNKGSYIIKRIMLEYVWPQRWWLVMAVFFMGMAAAGTSLSAYVMKDVIDKVFVDKEQSKLFAVGLMVIGAFLIKGTGAYGSVRIMAYIGGVLIVRLRNQVYRKLLWMDLSFFHSRSVGELMYRVNGDVDLMRILMADFAMGVGRSATTVIGLLIVMFSMQWKLALIAIFFFPIMFGGVSRLRKGLRSKTFNLRKTMETYQARLTENFIGIHRIKTSAAEAYESRVAQVISGRMFRTQMNISRTVALIGPMMELFAGIAITAVIIYGGQQVIEGGTSAGSFFAFLTALLMLYEPAKRMASMSAAMQGGLIGAQRVFELLDFEGGMREIPNAPSLNITEGKIVFDNVSFCYGAPIPTNAQTELSFPMQEVDVEKDVLRDITLTVKRGEKVALVGASGAGKSTLVKLVPRLYDVQQGVISIDGQDIRDVSLLSLRRQIGFVSQDLALFEGSIFENIVYGTAKRDYKSFEEVCKKAHIWDFIQSLPQKEKTIVGTQGVLLSGGQKQRVSIARALLKDAPILILDEATSALDTQTEKRIQQDLDNLTEGRTTIVVAHRLSTVYNADRIYVLADGKVVESGSHQELLSAEGVYAKLCQMQTFS